MATVTLDLLPFTVPTAVTVVAAIGSRNEGYKTPVPEVLISSLDAATRQELIDEFALAILAI